MSKASRLVLLKFAILCASALHALLRSAVSERCSVSQVSARQLLLPNAVSEQTPLSLGISQRLRSLLGALGRGARGASAPQRLSLQGGREICVSQRTEFKVQLSVLLRVVN